MEESCSVLVDRYVRFSLLLSEHGYFQHWDIVSINTDLQSSFKSSVFQPTPKDEQTWIQTKSKWISLFSWQAVFFLHLNDFNFSKLWSNKPFFQWKQPGDFEIPTISLISQQCGHLSPGDFKKAWPGLENTTSTSLVVVNQPKKNMENQRIVDNSSKISNQELFLGGIFRQRSPIQTSVSSISYNP